MAFRLFSITPPMEAKAVRSRITGEFGLFSLGKINVDAVRKK